MNRRIVVIPLIAMLSFTPALAGCEAVETITDAFGPKPNQTLVNLATQAEANGDTNAAQELFAEITRVCGLKEDNSVPPSCERSEMAADTSGEKADSLVQAYINAAPEAPAESRELLAKLAVDTAAAEPATSTPTPPTLPSDAPSSAQAAALLEFEYAHVYGLDFARAFASEDQLSRIDSLISSAEARIDALHTALGDAALVPAPAAAYQPAGLGLPTNEGEAKDYVGKLAQAESTTWRAAVADALNDEDNAYSPEWVEWVARVAGTTSSQLTS